MFNSSILALFAFLLVALAAASSGAVFRPGDWFQTIVKPRWTPPNRAFPTVWAVLYLAMAVAGWLVWRRVGLAPLPFTFYAAQLVFNAAWSALFFGLRRPDVAFADLVLLWLSIAGTLVTFATIDGFAALLFVPYLAWVTIAGALNLWIWRHNRERLALGSSTHW